MDTGGDSMDEEREELISRRLTDAVRESVEKELKRRYWWLGLITLIVTSGTVTLIVNAILADARLKLETARAVQELSTDRINKASEEVGKLTEKTAKVQAEFEKRATDAEARFTGLAARGKKLADEFSVSSENSLKVTSDLRIQTDKLAIILRELINEPGVSPTKRIALLAKIDDIQRSLNGSEQGIQDATSKVEALRKDFSSAMLGKWTIERWLNSRGRTRTGILSIDRRTGDNTYSGTLTVDTDDFGTIIEEVAVTRNEATVQIDSKVVKGPTGWAPDKFTLEFKDDTLRGRVKDEGGVTGEVAFRKIL
jgi:hypothetical protein